MSWDGLNRRKFPRANFPCLIKLSDGHSGKSGELILCHTENVGIGGVCVICKKELRMLTELDVEVELLNLGDNIKCRGKVVWSIRRDVKASKKPLFYDIGVEFTDLDLEDQVRIKEAVSRLIKNKQETPYK